MTVLQNNQLDEIDLEAQHRETHLEKHISEDFNNRIDAIAFEIKNFLAMYEYVTANEIIKKANEMIQNEIKDNYAKGLLLSFIIEKSNFAFYLPGVCETQKMFEETWAQIEKEGDLILMDSYRFYAQFVTENRARFDALKE